MPLLNYQILAKYKNGKIFSLISPILNKEFIEEYNRIKEREQEQEKGGFLDIVSLREVMEQHISGLQLNQFRIPITKAATNKNNINYDINVLPIDVHFNMRLHEFVFERWSRRFAVSVMLLSSVFVIMQYTLAARLSTSTASSFFSLIIPGVLGSTVMVGFIFRFSGALENMQVLGRKIDDKLWRKPVIEEQGSLDMQACCTISNCKDAINRRNAALLLSLCLSFGPALMSVGLHVNSNYQSLTSMGIRLDEKGDKMFSLDFIYGWAAFTAVFDTIFYTLQNSSYALQAARAIEPILQRCCAQKKTSAIVAERSDEKAFSDREGIVSDKFLQNNYHDSSIAV